MLYVSSLLANAFRCFVRRAFKYKTSTADVIFGLGSEQEMCIDFVTFYPAEPLVSITNGYCGNEGSCGGQKLKPLTAVTLPQLNAVRSFPCTGVDAACGAKSGSSWAGNEDVVVPKCEKCTGKSHSLYSV